MVLPYMHYVKYSSQIQNGGQLALHLFQQTQTFEFGKKTWFVPLTVREFKEREKPLRTESYSANADLAIFQGTRKK